MNTLMKIPAIFFCLVLFVKTGATEIDPDNGTITGRIVDNNSSQPVSYASVALLNVSDTTIITGVITDANGSFQISEIPFGKYNLKVSFVGYKSSVISNIELSRKQKKVDLPEMKLAEDITILKEAVISQERLKGEEKADRTVFTLNDDIRKASASGLSVLKHIPSVSVDFMENVALEGQSNIQFYVDGVLRNKEFIAQLNPQLIDKVELVTNPGVKYDSDISGVINIVLRKINRYGINGGITLPASNPEKIILNPKANIEYGNQNFRIYAGDRMHFERFKGQEILSTRLDESFSNPYYFQKTGAGINSWRNNYLNYGIDWFINDKTQLNFLGEWRNHTGIAKNYKNESKTFVSDILSEYFRTNKNTLDDNNNYFYSIFLKRKFDNEGNEFTAEAYINRQTGYSKYEFTDNYIDMDDLNTIIYSQTRNEFTSNVKNNTEIKLNYAFMLKNIKNELGVRTYTSRMTNDFRNNFSTEELINEMNDDFRYNENRQAAYYNVTGKTGKFTWQAGVKGEYSYLTINKNSNSEYYVFLLQLSISKSFEKDRNLKFSYRKQIYRPGINSLNPFETWSDSLHMRIGNPGLDPTLEHRYELVYSKNYKSNFISPKIYYRNTSNAIQDVTSVNSNGVTVIMQDNVGHNQEYGIGLSNALQITKWWKFNSNLTVYNRIYNTNINEETNNRQEKVSYRFNFSNMIALPKSFNLMVMSNYGSPNISYQRTFSRDLLLLFGIQKKISDRSSIEGFYNPILRNFTYSKVETRTPGYLETWEGQINVYHLFSVEFTYNFNYGNKIKKINRSADYEKEEGRGGI